MPRIAVVDNDLDFLQFLHDLLDGTGWEMTTFREVNSTFTLLKAEPPDLILLDLGASATSASWGILLRLQRDRATEDIPILVCATGQAHLTKEERELLGPGVVLLPKPFDIDALFHSMAEALLAGSIRRGRPLSPGTSAAPVRDG